MGTLDTGNKTADIQSSRNVRNVPVERHSSFYFADDPMAIFLVENRLFKVHRYYLIQESEVFRDMFSIPSGTTEGEGMDDEHPIILPGVTAKEFELLLKHFYAIPPPTQGDCRGSGQSEEDRKRTQEENLTILDIAQRFAFDNVCKLMIERLEPAKIPICQRIRFGDKCNLDNWLLSAYKELLDREESLSMDELEALGLDRVIRFIQARDSMRKERLDRAKTDLDCRSFCILNLEQHLVRVGYTHHHYPGCTPPASLITDTDKVVRKYFSS